MYVWIRLLKTHIFLTRTTMAKNQSLAAGTKLHHKFSGALGVILLRR